MYAPKGPAGERSGQPQSGVKPAKAAARLPKPANSESGPSCPIRQEDIMIARGLTSWIVSQVRSQPRMARGVKDSVTMSAQRTRSRISSRPSGLAGSTVIMRLPAFMLWNIDEPSGWVASSSMKGWRVRAVSMRVLDSMRTVLTPKSQRARVPAGPAMTHIRSSILRSESGGRIGVAAFAVLRLAARRLSARTSSVCSPSIGAGRWYSIGVSESRAKGPGNLAVAPPRSTSRQ